MSLSGRLTLAMVALVSLTAALAGAVTYRTLAAAVVPSELARVQAHVQRQAARLNDVVSAARNDVLAFGTGAAALDGIVRAHVNGGMDAQDGVSEGVWLARMGRRFAAELQSKPAYAQFRVIAQAAGGREILRVDRSGARGEARMVPDAELRVLGERDYFTETRKLPAGSVRLSKIELNQEAGEIQDRGQPVLRASTPIYSAAGEFFGILMIHVDLRDTFSALHMPEHPAGQVYLVDEQGQYLVHPESERTFALARGRPDRLQGDYPILSSYLGGNESRVGVLQLNAGEPMGLAFLPVRPGGGPWLALVEIVSEAQLVAPLAAVRRSSLLAGGLVALLAMALAVGLSRSLTGPLVSLTQTVESFSAGRADPAKVAATGELGRLARAFENMQLEVGAKTAALRRSELRFRALLEHSADGILLVSAAGEILYLSPSVAAIEGYAPEELVGRDSLEHVHPDDLPLLQALLQQVLEKPGRPVPVLWRRRHKDGRWLWLEGVATNWLADPAIGAIVTNYRDVTERKRREVRFARLIDSNAQGVLFWNANGEITEANAAFLALVGYSRQDLVAGRVGWAAMTPPEYAELDQRALAEMAAQGHCTPFEKEYIRKDGTRVPVLIGAASFEDNPGEGVCFVLDITARKQAAEALRASETRYRTLFEHAPDGIVIADRQSRYLDANTSLCRMLGYAREELIGRHASEVVASAEVPHIGQALSVLEKRTEYAREWIMRRKDGSNFAADVIGTQMPDGNLLGMIRDISDRRQAQQALRESEEHFRFLNDLVEATRTRDDAAEIMSVTARMLGEHLHVSRCAYAAVEQDGELFSILHDYTDGCSSSVGRYQLSNFGARAVATLRGGQTLILRDVAAELSPGEGAEMFSAIGIGAIITCPLVKEGRLRAMMAVHQAAPRDWHSREIALVQDVVERCWATIERRTAEEKIQQLNAELEQRVIERTAQLEAANKELEAFSYSVSHDLRSPLRAIDGFAQAVIEDFGPHLPDAGQGQLQVIRRSAQRMGQLIDDLLKLSRLGRAALEQQPVNTSRLVQEALQELGLAQPNPRLKISTGELPPCWGDASLLKQVWLNLLDNAAKYSRKRDPAVIEIGSERHAGGVVYSVRDNGTGFDMRYANKLFVVFQRLHRKEDFEGTGVGLATVQRIIHRHGGRIWAEAVLDRGATFYFSLTELATLAAPRGES